MMFKITLELTVAEANAIYDLILRGQGYYIDQYGYRNDTVNEWLNTGDRVRSDIWHQYIQKGE